MEMSRMKMFILKRICINIKNNVILVAFIFKDFFSAGKPFGTYCACNDKDSCTHMRHFPFKEMSVYTSV